MITRDKDFNSEIGDWEFTALNGGGSEVTAKGKLENCQTCHLPYEHNDYITREYLPIRIENELK